MVRHSLITGVAALLIGVVVSGITGRVMLAATAATVYFIGSTGGFVAGRWFEQQEGGA